MQSLAAQTLEYQADACLVLDPWGNRIIQANRAARTLLGYDSEAMQCLKASELFRDQLPAVVVFTEAVMTQGRRWCNDIICYHRHGDPITVEMAGSRVEHGEHPYLVLNLADQEQLLAQRERAEALRYHRAGIRRWKTIENIFQEIERENALILSAAGEGIYGINADGKTTFVNPAAERMLGFKAEELIGRDIHGAIHHSHGDGSLYPSRSCPIYAAFADGEVHFVDNEVFWRKDGRALPVEYTSTPIEDNGQLVGAVVIFRDISERKEAEARLRHALAEVETLRNKLEQENAYLLEEIRNEHNYKEIVGASAAIRNVIKQIELVAPTDASVLISGESGTGKELIARAIHESSARSGRPLIRVNCASIPRELFESEFFGHVKGAFTGAVSDRAGRFELADGGTLFLDEVGEIPLELQSKLLRVLQEQQFERVGDNRTRAVDVRVIAATNRDLKQAVSDKGFREDLYFRLNVFPIESVALRSRRDDVPLLASHFIQRACEKFNKTAVKPSKADMQRLQAYPWPGNIRELINVIERAVILAQGERLTLDLPEAVDAGDPLERTDTGPIKIMSDTQRRQRERENIINALKATGGKVFGPNGAAQLLDIKPTTLASRIKRFNINKVDYSRC
ncbi:histidine kinase [Candidatus Tenderia electrophaga]|jgi:PAS domain S-box-containing protein|uniref:Histidine kinase n=1 Tax=Candidatus Tenderia electrophaga TaxID=1748243 RepID=A0A0S2TCS2_9GAMM|nr:histidine kinase [Candidatus Tenderia electrophaga]